PAYTVADGLADAHVRDHPSQVDRKGSQGEVPFFIVRSRFRVELPCDEIPVQNAKASSPEVENLIAASLHDEEHAVEAERQQQHEVWRIRGAEREGDHPASRRGGPDGGGVHALAPYI